MDSDQFYESLPAFSEFLGITDDQFYRPAPPDWFIIVADIQGSTRAIEQGRYRDVNTIGAAVITSVMNVLGGRAFPFVFGGDGATLLIAPRDLEAVSRTLSGLQQFSLQKFGFRLRIGIVPVREVLVEGNAVEVAKFQLAGDQSIAAFRGGGLSLAEKKIKAQPDKYILREAAALEELSGLSCRWQQIPSDKGVVISMLVMARGENKPATYRKVLESIGGANPVATKRMTYKNFFSLLRTEMKFHRTLFSRTFLERIRAIFISILLFRLGVKTKQFDTENYLQSLPRHSDYRKFDDLLRMVLDCTPIEAVKIRNDLQRFFERGEIYYGLHESEASLMTCYVRTASQEGGHIHFIDGGNGGYAMAAKQLKDQIALG